MRAGLGELALIPGSMGTRSYVVRGKGNRDSFESCSHGAGRVMSRGEAKRKITLDDHAKATAGVECRKDEGVLDESPAAYKNVDDVIAASSDLVEVVHTASRRPLREGMSTNIARLGGVALPARAWSLGSRLTS